MVSLPSIAVIIPVHNGARFIADAIASIRAQTALPDEVIVVDDGSTDVTVRCLDALQPGLRVLSQPNRGPSAARNLGRRAVQADLVAFLDADDTWSPGTLQHLRQCLVDNPETSVAQGLIQRMVWTEQGFIPQCEPYQFINLGSALFRREVFGQVGDFDETLWENEDTDWFLQAWEKGVNKRVVPRTTLYYRLHDANMTLQQNLVAGGVVRLMKRHLDRTRSQGWTTDRHPIGREPWPLYRGAPS
jgi:glycosyltransferase involved in cell wall biosynthesis